jgi:indole-3-glycerol phosphate synthase
MTILDDIAAYKRREVAAAKAERPVPQLMHDARGASPPRRFLAALESAKAARRPALIAEIKKASPSSGLIRADFDPAALARAYEKGGATCLSVLTDGPSFQGAALDLAAARKASTLPVLRKDFMLDTYQVVQSRALGADCILIILAMVNLSVASDLLGAARDLDMDALVEVHDARELDTALTLDARLIGINNRDLNTFVTDIATALTLAPRIPAGRQVVAVSGLSTPDDLRRLAKAGIASYLIGESLMRAPDVELATRELLAGAGV